MSKAYDFLKECGYFYVLTINNNHYIIDSERKKLYSIRFILKGVIINENL